jgi:hypothetical protein
MLDLKLLNPLLAIGAFIKINSAELFLGILLLVATIVKAGVIESTGGMHFGSSKMCGDCCLIGFLGVFS